MRQQTLAMTMGFERYSKKTKRAAFLEEMEQVVPWGELCSLVEPHYPKAGNGRRPVGIERMLRIYFLQQWFNLSDPAVEEALYDSPLMRGFAGIDLGNEPVPDETTVCKFRHLLEEHNLGGSMLETVNFHLQSRGIKITTGTIVDATIIHAPSSTKNREQKRDPEMHQTRKGKQWYFGMKAHVGVDSKHKIVHSAVVTAAHVADCTVLPELLHGEETKVWGDQAYRGQTEAIREAAPLAQDLTNKRYRAKNRIDEVQKAKNRNKSRVRSKVEHVFGVIKRKFGYGESSLPGNPQERHSGVHAVRVEQPVCLAPQIAVHPDGVVSLLTARRRDRSLVTRHSASKNLKTCPQTPRNAD